MSAILIIEDDAAFREMLQSIFELGNYTVFFAETTSQGLEIVATHPVDAVLTDYHLPQVNGLEFCRAFRKVQVSCGRRIPVWVMTGSVDLTVNQVRAAGAEGLIRKPFRPHELLALLDRALHPDSAQEVA